MVEDSQKRRTLAFRPSLKSRKLTWWPTFSFCGVKYDVMNDLMSFGIHRLWSASPLIAVACVVDKPFSVAWAVRTSYRENFSRMVGKLAKLSGGY